MHSGACKRLGGIKGIQYFLVLYYSLLTHACSLLQTANLVNLCLLQHPLALA